MQELAQEAQVAAEIASVGETKRQQEEKALNVLLYANGLRVVDIPVRIRFLFANYMAVAQPKYHLQSCPSFTRICVSIACAFTSSSCCAVEVGSSTHQTGALVASCVSSLCMVTPGTPVAPETVFSGDEGTLNKSYAPTKYA